MTIKQASLQNVGDPTAALNLLEVGQSHSSDEAAETQQSEELWLFSEQTKQQPAMG